eukprot:snap_masked-scaffold_29-processed-gene-3.20-mRNA-1 protein AED:1.00 eAED:1.00 QI:0/-1/0/0/-1/1/1/0/70
MGREVLKDSETRATEKEEARNNVKTKIEETINAGYLSGGFVEKIEDLSLLHCKCFRAASVLYSVTHTVTC